MPKGKQIKMDLGSFLSDDKFGSNDSWADDFNPNDLSTPQSGTLDLGASMGAQQGGTRSTSGYGGSSGGYGGSSGGFGGSGSEEKWQREEYPVPDEPPFTARVSNLPHEMEDSLLYDFLVDGLKLDTPDVQITDFYAPKDSTTGGLRGFAFVSFKEKNLLEQALTLSAQPLGGRTAYISVAAPNRRGGDRGMGGGRPSREPEVDLDWGSARSTRAAQPESSYRRGGARSYERDEGGSRYERGDRPPRRDEPEFDWNSARSTREEQPQRRERSYRSDYRSEGTDREGGERPPRREEPVLDWGSARNTQEEQPRRRSQRNFSSEGGRSTEGGEFRRVKKPEPEFDWNSARDSVASRPERTQREPRESARRTPRTPKPEEPAVDWGNLRGSALKEKRTTSKRGTSSRSTSGRGASQRSGSQKSEKPATTTAEKQDGPKQSGFNVLSLDDDDETESEPKAATTATPAAATTTATATATATTQETDAGLEKATADLSLDDTEGWDVVGKK